MYAMIKPMVTGINTPAIKLTIPRRVSIFVSISRTKIPTTTTIIFSLTLFLFIVKSLSEFFLIIPYIEIFFYTKYGFSKNIFIIKLNIRLDIISPI
ncbi:MAG: hypothetical protein ATN36_01025 [Epulopiscium sp. Nele67-Bin005]|nr:MAG: hypothetical protein ATN36_01025 [Epulopiscium sp. Nele67-Bin005]